MKVKNLKMAVLIGAAALVTGFAGEAAAQTATSNLQVSATVAQTCTVTANALNFGAYDPVGANAATALTGAGSLSVTCTNGSSGITLTLGNGGNYAANGSQRGMGPIGGQYLSYEIYQPTATTPSAACGALTQRWGTTGAEILTPSGVTWSAVTPQTFNVCGNVPAAQNVPAGTYNDTVVATVNF
ncbi:MAG: spore coat U domain-containing protein [Burkholderiales bacterium]